MQEVEWSSLDTFAQWDWWERYACNVDARRHRRHADADYYVLLLLKRSTFSSISRYAFRGFPNTVMGPLCPCSSMECHVCTLCCRPGHLSDRPEMSSRDLLPAELCYSAEGVD